MEVELRYDPSTPTKSLEEPIMVNLPCVPGVGTEILVPNTGPGHQFGRTFTSLTVTSVELTVDESYNHERTVIRVTEPDV